MALTGAQLQDIREALEQRRDSLRERVEELGRAPEPGTTIGFGKRIGDGTTEAISRLTDIGVGRSAEASLERVTRALEKLDDGTYGVCDVCGAAIPSGRLEAKPDSVLCITCAAASADAPERRR